jgi:hypothetical protein
VGALVGDGVPQHSPLLSCTIRHCSVSRLPVSPRYSTHSQVTKAGSPDPGTTTSGTMPSGFVIGDPSGQITHVGKLEGGTMRHSVTVGSETGDATGDSTLVVAREKESERKEVT